MANETKTFDADVRYGSTFLDVDKHRQAVKGEVMSDKMTGEMYLKRPTDEKIISFRQKSTTMYEAIQEFNIQYQAASGFLYPQDPGSFLLGMKYTVDEFLPVENKRDILKENIAFNNGTDTNPFRFEVSQKTNGFFIKPMTRLGDKNVCGYLSGLFAEDEVVSFGDNLRSFTDWLDLSSLYSDPYQYAEWSATDGWAYSTAMIDINIRVNGNDESNVGVENVMDVSMPIRLNEYNYIPFPAEYNEDMYTISSIVIMVNKIYFPKLQYERFNETASDTSSGVTVTMQNLLEPDLRCVLNSIDMYYFINNAGQIPNDSAMSVNMITDINIMNQTITDIGRANGAKAVQTQIERPDSFPVDTMWAEVIRSGSPAGGMEDVDSETTFEELEKSLYHDNETYLEYTRSVLDVENILVSDV